MDQKGLNFYLTFRGIVTRRVTTGNLIKNLKFNEKTPMKSLDLIISTNYISSWYLMNAGTSKLYFIPTHLENEKMVQFDLLQTVTHQGWNKLKGKVNIVQPHMLNTNLLFVGTTNGILILKMDERTPNVAIGNYVPTEEDIYLKQNATNTPVPEDPEIGLDVHLPKFMSLALPTTPERSTYYAVGTTLYKKTIGNGQYKYSTKIKELSRNGNFIMDISPSGKYLSIYWEHLEEFEILSCDSWKTLAQKDKTKSIVWGSHSDHLGVLKSDGKKISLLWATNNT